MRIEFAKGAKPSRHLWVGGIGQSVSREQIEGKFERFGAMEDFKFLRDRNCAFVDFVKIEDAMAAVDSMNRRNIGDKELRVDFGRSQQPKQEICNRPGAAPSHEEWRVSHTKIDRDHPDQFRASANAYKGTSDELRQSERGFSGEPFCGPSDGCQGGARPGTTDQTLVRTRVEKEEPSDVLWVGFPLLSKVDEEGLRRAFVPYGEVERVKTFPGRTYAFVQFKNIEEATRAKDALEGKLFNDPRVHIRFSNSEIGPVDNPKIDRFLSSPSQGREATGYLDNAVGRIATSDRFHSIISPLHPTGLRPEYYPGGLAQGAALARAVGTGPGISLGQVVGRVLRTGGSDERMLVDQTGSHGGRVLPVLGARPGGRYSERWEFPEGEIMAREPKRLRQLHVGDPDSAQSLIHGGRQYSESDKFVPGPNPGRQDYGLPASIWITGGGDEYSKGIEVPRVCLRSVQFDGPLHAAAGQGHARSLTIPGLGPTGGPKGVGQRDSFDTSSGVTGVNEGWRWHGTIAKGGTPVCRAQCLPVGKGIDVTVPDVVNCTARTDLDMLAKHVYQAGDFGVVFFVPEADPDVPPYHDFMHYLGEKHRAGVAKLADGTTLFLVPPSEFSERVLKVPGNNCLFGVVLKSLPVTAGHAQLQQHPQPPPQQHHLSQQQVQPPQQFLAHQQQNSQSKGPILVNGNSIPDRGPITRPSPPQGQPPAVTNSILATSQLTGLASGLPTTLTPELIVSLTALLPRESQSPAFTSAPFPLSGSNILPPLGRNIMGTGHFMGMGAPNLVSTMPVASAIDNRLIYRQPQSNQQIVQSQGWPSVLSSQAPHATVMQQPLLAPPAGQVHQVYLGAQRQEFSGYGGQQVPQHPRPLQYPASQLGSAPLLPSDQLSQLTALLTQRQQQPAQQHATQLLQQHYQHQQPPVHSFSHQHPQSTIVPCNEPQGQSYHQQTPPPPSQHQPLQPPQQQWAQGGLLLQHASQLLGHSPVPKGENNGGWDGALMAQVHQQQPQMSSPTPQQSKIHLSQQQLQHPLPTGGVTSEQGGSASQDDAECQKRFQATLQLAAALLQQMQDQQTPGQGTSDQ